MRRRVTLPLGFCGLLMSLLFFGGSVFAGASSSEKPVASADATASKVSEKNSDPIVPESSILEPGHLVQKIVISSRANPLKPQGLWPFIAAEKPDLFISTGDLIQPNIGTPADIQENYKVLKLQPEFAKFRSHFPLLAAWGQGDSGEIAGDKATKEVAKLEYLKFYINDSQFISPRQAGMYHGLLLGPAEHRLHLIFLDTHFFKMGVGKDRTLLGDEQWNWLQSEIQKKSDLTIFVFSDSLLSESKDISAWPEFGNEKRRLLTLMSAYGKITKQKSVIFLTSTGYGEIRKKSLSKKLDIQEISAGGLNRKPINAPENTKLRWGKPVSSFNYALLNIDWKSKKIHVKFLSDEPKKAEEKSWSF